MLRNTDSLIIIFIVTTTVQCYYYEEQKPIYLTASVGDYVIFNCNVDFPQNIPIPYMLNWTKEVSAILFKPNLYKFQNNMREESNFQTHILLFSLPCMSFHLPCICKLCFSRFV